MIDARLIGYKHYVPWADAIIAALDAPPLWIIDLALARYYQDAIIAISRFVNSEPSSFESAGDEYLACLFVRHDRGELSWATFLCDAGEFADSSKNSTQDCEYFYEMLTNLEDERFDDSLALVQRAKVERELRPSIETIRPLYEVFDEYFRDYAKTRL